MRKLRRGVVSVVDPLVVRIGDEERPAWAGAGLVGEVREGDEVIDEDRLFFAAALAAGDGLAAAALVEAVR